MSKTDSQRKINKNLFFGKLRLAGLTLAGLGKIMQPPIRRSRVCQIIHGGKPVYRLKEISTILQSNIATIFPKQKEDDSRVE
jgi:hypothetical protein